MKEKNIPYADAYKAVSGIGEKAETAQDKMALKRLEIAAKDDMYRLRYAQMNDPNISPEKRAAAKAYVDSIEQMAGIKSPAALSAAPTITPAQAAALKKYGG
jgi:hypothetical protein